MSGHPMGMRGQNAGRVAGPRPGMFHPVPSGMPAPHFQMPRGPRPGMFPVRGGFAGPNGFRHRGIFFRRPFRHHHRFPFFANSCFFNPFLCGAGFFGASAFWPGPIFGPDYYEAYNQPQEVAPVQYQTDPYLQEEIRRLADEVESLRQEQQARNTPQTYIVAPSTPEQSTLLILRNGKRLEVQNYGIAGQTLWIFTEKRANKLPLADLDLKATRKANADRGVEFLAPTQ